MKTYLVTIRIIGAHYCIYRSFVTKTLAEAIDEANQLIKEKEWNAHIKAVYERVWLGEEHQI